MHGLILCPMAHMLYDVSCGNSAIGFDDLSPPSAWSVGNYPLYQSINMNVEINASSSEFALLWQLLLSLPPSKSRYS
jgi:hypothetical protein